MKPTADIQNEQGQNQPKAKSKARKVISVLFGVLAGVVLIFSVFIMITTMTSRAKGEDPSFFGRTLHVVVTGSMKPEIKVNDLIVVKKVDTAELDAYLERRKDDIASVLKGEKKWADILTGDQPETLDLVFYSPKKDITIVHRLAYGENGKYRTYAINQSIYLEDGTVVELTDEILDDWISPNNIKGVVVAKSTFFGRIFYFFLTNSWVLFIILLGILAVVIVSEVVNIIKAKNQLELEKSAKNAEEIKARARADALRDAGLTQDAADANEAESNEEANDE